MIKQCRLILTIAAVAIAVNITALTTSAKAKKVDNKCTLTTTVFARGSGQEINAKEADTFHK